MKNMCCIIDAWDDVACQDIAIIKYIYNVYFVCSNLHSCNVGWYMDIINLLVGVCFSLGRICVIIAVPYEAYIIPIHCFYITEKMR